MKLFLSFSSMLRFLSENKITQEDLNTALFFFGCARTHALAPWEPVKDGSVCNEIEWFFKEDMARGEKEHARLVEALFRAELEGRCVWKKHEDGSEPHPARDFFELMKRNGIKLDELDLSPNDRRYFLSYPGIEDLCRKHGLPVEAMWR